MSNKYEYLFPFEKVSQGSKILIYGAGDVGQEYLQQMMMTGYCEVVGFVDRNWDKYGKMIVPIYPPEYIRKVKYDYIMLALKTAIHKKSIYNTLDELGVNLSHVVFQEARMSKNLLAEDLDNEIDLDRTFSFQSTEQSIALKMGPGLGDCIQRKLFINALVRLMPACQIDIYTPNVAYIKSIYTDIKNIKNVFDDAGVLYATVNEQYLLSVELFFILKVDQFDYTLAKKIDYELSNVLSLLVKRCEEYDLTSFPLYKSRIHFERTIYKGGDCYSLYDYTGIIRKADKIIHIPLQESYEDKFAKKQLTRFITISTGSTLVVKGDQSIDTRQWPDGYYQDFVNCFKRKYPGITIVQIGDQNTKKLGSIDCYIFDESLELIKYVLKNAIFHLSTEGGLMHLATQLGTKCITIFGPTQVQIYGYKQNINIVSDKCSGCCYLYDGLHSCARGAGKAECMYDIGADLVMEKIGEYMENQL